MVKITSTIEYTDINKIIISQGSFFTIECVCVCVCVVLLVGVISCCYVDVVAQSIFCIREYFGVGYVVACALIF
jgi:hypothetical protein